MTRPVNFRDFPKSVNAHGEGWQQRLLTAIERYDFTRPNGHIERFERVFADYCQTSHCVATSSGTTALLLAYATIGLGPDDEFITAANTFTATVEAARFLGARPVFVDIDPETYAMSPEHVRRAITPKTRAIVAFHPFGRLCDVEALKEIAHAHDILLIEEACQAHGAQLRGRKSGAFGDLAVFSFGASKPFGGLGEGGALVTSHDNLATQARLLNNHGRQGAHHILNGLNFRMHPVEAAFLADRASVLPNMLEERRDIAARYNHAFAPLGIAQNPVVPMRENHAYYLYVIEVPNRERVTRRLTEKGIGWAIHYATAIHKQVAQSDLEPAHLPVTDRLQERMLSLPMFNGLEPAEIDAVIETVTDAVIRSRE